MDVKKYQKQFILPPEPCMDWAMKNMVERAPVWCSVDLRDGNQALIEPMGLETKLEFFNLLVEIGFKEIEVGFPAASETEYDFVRALIDRNLIPDDVTIQVLTQAREHIIKKTFEAICGAKNVIVHVYNSTSVAQREQVFRKDREAIKQIAVDGAKLLKKLTDEAGANYRFEYSPESFTGTEPDYALEVCNAVLDVWQPTADRKAVINLPATVENAMPHVYAQQVEYMCKHLKFRENVVVSLHPHNDRGCGVASAEFGLLAGADRVEGTLFGNGERTGNCDVVTLAMNMYSQGVDPGLDFSNMPYVAALYQSYTNMRISPRQPYAGELVFAAFSGSHQDAIAKGMKFREETGRTVWDVPYLPIDPKDVGRQYDSDVIRINSQSGKGGVGYVLRHQAARPHEGGDELCRQARIGRFAQGAQGGRDLRGVRQEVPDAPPCVRVGRSPLPSGERHHRHCRDQGKGTEHRRRGNGQRQTGRRLQRAQKALSYLLQYHGLRTARALLRLLRAGDLLSGRGDA